MHLALQHCRIYNNVKVASARQRRRLCNPLSCHSHQLYEADESAVAAAMSDDSAPLDAPAFEHTYRTEKGMTRFATLFLLDTRWRARAGKRRGIVTSHRNVLWLIEAGHQVSPRRVASSAR